MSSQIKCEIVKTHSVYSFEQWVARWRISIRVKWGSFEIFQEEDEVPDDETVNQMIARHEEEFDLFMVRVTALLLAFQTGQPYLPEFSLVLRYTGGVLSSVK